jgi:hypothetical protein
MRKRSTFYAMPGGAFAEQNFFSRYFYLKPRLQFSVDQT